MIGYLSVQLGDLLVGQAHLINSYLSIRSIYFLVIRLVKLLATYFC
jgi:hypothetical protein